MVRRREVGPRRDPRLELGGAMKPGRVVHGERPDWSGPALDQLFGAMVHERGGLLPQFPDRHEAELALNQR